MESISPLDTPVVLVIFNRPDLTARVLERVAAARPRRLHVIGDGARKDRPGEAELVHRTREVAAGITWDCEVTHDYATENLGCRNRLATGLTGAFERFEAAIVLEDDILPQPSFFPFCQQMLRHYRDDSRVMMVSGFNPLGEWRSAEQQYHFSFCGSIWGWASWRRAWRFYDVQMRRWRDPAVRERLIDVFGGEEIARPRLESYQRTAEGKIDTWDSQWSFARACQSGLSVVPAMNLIQNLGFRADATHTRGANPVVTEVPVGEQKFPLRFHDWVMPDRAYDVAFTRRLTAPTRR